MNPGLFITFEGIDGAGKSSHIDAIAERLRRSGAIVVCTREPGGTPLGERLRGELLHTAMDALTEALLVFAARREHIVQLIGPALARGECVLCDRFTDATFAYQGGGRGFDLEPLARLEEWAQQGLQPDLTLWFDLPATAAAARRAAARAPDRFEAQDEAFFERVISGYRARARAPGAIRAHRRTARAGSGRGANRGRAATARLVTMAGVATLPWHADALALALRTQRAHALLVHGAQGAGQFEFALALARAWLCESPAAERPQGLACGHCDSCHLAQAEQVHPDLCVLLPEAVHVKAGWWQKDDDRDKLESGERKPSEWIKIEQVRAAIEFATQTRSRARPKVIVIHPAERLQLVAASALLKLLEEPQGGLRLVLASADAVALLATVRSRCQALVLPAPDPEQAVRWLAQAGVDDARLLLAASGGQPLAALERHAQGLDATLWRRLPSLVAAGDAQPLAKLPLPLLIESLHKLCHDAMSAAVGAAPRYFAPGSVPASAKSLGALTAWARALNRIASHAGHPWNAPVLLESLLAQGRRALAGEADSVHSRR